MKNKILKFIRGVLGRSWVVPLVAVVGSAICAAMVCYISGLTVGADLERCRVLGNVVDYFLAPQLLLFVFLPIWLIVRTVVLLVRKLPGVGLAWLWSVLSAIPLAFCMVISAFGVNMGYYDTFTEDIELPEEWAPAHQLGVAVPGGFSFYEPLRGGELSPVAKKWKEHCKDEWASVSVSADEELSDNTPNLDKITAEAPELLWEYLLRASCHEVLSPGISVAPYRSLLHHPDMSAEKKRFAAGKDEPWEKPLSQGWCIRSTTHRFSDDSIPARYELKKVKLLDAALAPLAANPTPEGLDALLPPLPEKPVIILHEGFQPGLYRLQLLVPEDYPQGSFRVKAREYTKGQQLSTRSLDDCVLSPVSHRGICGMAELPDFTVYSGEWGEIYASVWELYFTPAEGGESRCVNSQLYLMQGWSR